jgi:hypothetical protein
VGAASMFGDFRLLARILSRVDTRFIGFGYWADLGLILGVCACSSFSLMCSCQDGWMSVDFDEKTSGSLRCLVHAEKINMDPRVCMAVRSCVCKLIIVSLDSLARIASVGCM